jgi:transcriptional regulator GlxA family with amidase domain
VHGENDKKMLFSAMAHRIAILVYPGFELLDATGPASVFAAANFALSQLGKSAFYTIEMISRDGGPVASSSAVVLQTRAFSQLPPSEVDTFLIVGAEAQPLLAVLGDPDVRAGVLRYAEAAPRSGSVCTGTFLLAAAGLVHRKRVATHWSACAPLAKKYPFAMVDPNALYVVDGKIWTSAGVTAGIDMALAMVAHDLDATIAGEVAKRLVLYARRPGYQSQFSPLLQAQVKANSPFAELIGWMQANLDQALDVPALAARAGLSERTFYRKFLAATGEPPARFVELIRLDAARMLLSQGLSLKAVATHVGLAPTQRLTKAFERRFGVTPRLFRETHANL